jgi:hypothetical protein
MIGQLLWRGALMAFAVGALHFGEWVVLRRRWNEVIPGWCFQSGAMSPARLLWFAKHYRIATVFDFRGANERGVAEEAAALRDTAVRHVHIPCGREPTRAAVQQFLQLADAERAAGRRILLHCKDGQGRAIYFAAVCLMEYDGLTGEQAFLAVRRFPKALRWIRFIVPRAGLLGPKNPKHAMIRQYRPRVSA